MDTSFVVMMAPLLLTTMMGEALLPGNVADDGLGRILLGCICCVMIFTPVIKTDNHNSSSRRQVYKSEMWFSTEVLTRLLLYLDGRLTDRGCRSGLSRPQWRRNRATLLDLFGRLLLVFGKLGQDLCWCTDQSLWRGKSCCGNFHSCWGSGYSIYEE